VVPPPPHTHFPVWLLWCFLCSSFFLWLPPLHVRHHTLQVPFLSGLWGSELCAQAAWSPDQVQALNLRDPVGDFCLQGTAGVQPPRPLGPWLRSQLQPPTTTHTEVCGYKSLRATPQAPGILSGLHPHSYLATAHYKSCCFPPPHFLTILLQLSYSYLFSLGSAMLEQWSRSSSNKPLLISHRKPLSVPRRFQLTQASDWARQGAGTLPSCPFPLSPRLEPALSVCVCWGGVHSVLSSSEAYSGFWDVKSLRICSPWPPWSSGDPEPIPAVPLGPQTATPHLQSRVLWLLTVQRPPGGRHGVPTVRLPRSHLAQQPEPEPWARCKIPFLIHSGCSITKGIQGSVLFKNLKQVT
jgi:hypothetical protein